jgi:hypothetical protein
MKLGLSGCVLLDLTSVGGLSTQRYSTGASYNEGNAGGYSSTTPMEQNFWMR